MTLGDLILLGEQLFIKAKIALGQGAFHPRDEARWLALETLGLPVDSPDESESAELLVADIQKVKAVYRQRIDERRPAAYLTGRAWLKGYDFLCDSRAIIPRSFIAELILRHFSPWTELDKDPYAVRRILDVCTGSGCLAIMAADFFPSAHVVACDLSLEALSLAEENRKSYELDDRIQLVHADVYQCMDSSKPCALDPTFDLIMANPPYVPESKMASLPPEFQHEPRMALVADDHGMAVVRKLLKGAAERLSPQGVLVVEIGHEKDACEAMLEAEFPGLFPIWIETEEQMDHVFLCRYADLIQHPWRPPQ